MLAQIFQELLCNRDDYVRALRGLLREIVRSARHDLNFTEFALGLMEERSGSKFKNMDSQLKVTSDVFIRSCYVGCHSGLVGTNVFCWLV